jgi:multidrug efflux system membrane fusion protein
VRAGEAAVQRAAIDLGYCTIRSPIDARAGDVLVHMGNLVGPADPQPLVVLLQTKPIQVEFTMPQQNLPEIRRRMAEGPVEVLAKAGGAEPRAGKLVFVDNTVDAATGTIHLKATFANEDEGLWPGQFLDVTLRLGVDRQATVVPSTAVQSGQSGTFLYVVKEDGTAESRPVTVARTAGDLALIADGLTDGETVITDGQLRVSPGARVSAAGSADKTPDAEPRP